MSIKIFEKVFNILLLVFIISVIVWSLASVLMTQKIDLKNSNKINTYFESIEKVKVEGKISYSYNIYTQDNNQFYKIAADYVSCFELDSFLSDVKRGQQITIFISDNNSFRKPSIIAINANKKNYIDQDCYNEKISENKIILPVIFSIFPIVLFLVIIYKKLKKRKNKTNT